MYRDTDIWYWQKQTHKQRIKMEFLTIYCFVFLLKMKPWSSFQVNEAMNVVFMILSGCFISEIVLNLSFRWVKKILVKSDSMFTLACEQALHVRVSHWALQYLEKALAAIFEAKNMARIGPDHWALLYISGDRAPILSSVKEVWSKTWRPMSFQWRKTRHFTS